MWLKDISLRRWSEERSLEGSVQFQGDEGNITVNLNQEEIIELVRTLSGVLVRNAAAAAKRLELATMGSAGINLIANKDDEKK